MRVPGCASCSTCSTGSARKFPNLLTAAKGLRVMAVSALVRCRDSSGSYDLMLVLERTLTTALHNRDGGSGRTALISLWILTKASSS